MSNVRERSLTVTLTSSNPTRSIRMTSSPPPTGVSSHDDEVGAGGLDVPPLQYDRPARCEQPAGLHRFDDGGRGAADEGRATGITAWQVSSVHHRSSVSLVFQV